VDTRLNREKTERCHGLFLGDPESGTPSMDIENVDMNYKANVHECSQREYIMCTISGFVPCYVHEMPVAPEYNNHYFENNI